ncbi:MAG: hypothetical protein ACNA8R_10950 [Nitriliruptoraceae bacterium]
MSEDARDLTIRIDSTEVSDTEVAAVTVAVAALTAGAGGGADAGVDSVDGRRGRQGPGGEVVAWRAAALLEGTGARRLGSLAALRDGHAHLG